MVWIMFGKSRDISSVVMWWKHNTNEFGKTVMLDLMKQNETQEAYEEKPPIYHQPPVVCRTYIKTRTSERVSWPLFESLLFTANVIL